MWRGLLRPRRLRRLAGHLLARPVAADDGEWDEDDEGIATLDGNRMLAVRAEAGEEGGRGLYRRERWRGDGRDAA